MRKLSILTALLLLVPSAGHAKSLDELLVEKGVITKGNHGMGGGAAKVYWDQGTRIEFPDNGFTTSIATLIQPRYEFTDEDESSTSENTSSFEINKAQLSVSGTALNKEFDYMLNFDLVGDDSGTSSSPNLLDAYITWNPCDGNWIRMGQFKTGISHQFNVADGALQFADRSMVSNFFDLGRQAGVSGGMWMGDKAWASLGLFNGETDGEGQNMPGVDTHHTATANARIYLMGMVDDSTEGDVAYSEEAGLALGVGYAYSSKDNDLGAGLEENDFHTANVDVVYKHKGMSIQGEFFYRGEDSENAVDSSSLYGLYVQGGYFIQPKKLEVAVRYALLDSDETVAAQDSANELSVSINHYWWEHHLKAQLGYVLQNDDPVGGGDDINTSRWLFQLSSWF